MATWSQAFHTEANRPVHHDLHRGNVLIDADGRLWLLDWDDLEVGDPALDYAILLWQLSAQPVAPKAAAEDDPSFQERFALYLRAQLFNDVIDSLADWDAASILPAEECFKIREAKEATHRQALQAYRA
jgi:aminoglycoside phosphotransferase (APT) family kinase protein